MVTARLRITARIADIDIFPATWLTVEDLCDHVGIFLMLKHVEEVSSNRKQKER